jgi:hypothetical protein
MSIGWKLLLFIGGGWVLGSLLKYLSIPVILLLTLAVFIFSRVCMNGDNQFYLTMGIGIFLGSYLASRMWFVATGM